MASKTSPPCCRVKLTIWLVDEVASNAAAVAAAALLWASILLLVCTLPALTLTLRPPEDRDKKTAGVGGSTSDEADASAAASHNTIDLPLFLLALKISNIISDETACIASDRPFRKGGGGGVRVDSGDLLDGIAHFLRCKWNIDVWLNANILMY